MRTTLLVLLVLLNTSLFSQNSKSKNFQTDNSSAYTSIFFKQIGSLRNRYDVQSGGTPMQIWQDPSNPNNIHAIYTYSAQVEQWTDRTVQYFFSSDKGTTWNFITNVPVEGYRSGFGTITGLSNGNALIALHTSASNNVIRTQIFADAIPGLGSFTMLDPGGLNSNKYLWPSIVATSSVSSENKFVFIASSQTDDSSFVNTGKSLSANIFGGYKPIKSDDQSYAIARGSDGRIGIVYEPPQPSLQVLVGDLYFIESTNDGNTFSSPTKIYHCDFTTDSMVVFGGRSIVYQNNSPKIVFTTAKYSSWWNRPSKIRFWSTNLPGADSTRSIIIADENNIPCNFPPTEYYDHDEAPLCYPSIGVSADNAVLFCSVLAQNSQVGGVRSINYNDVYVTRSFNAGSNWYTPERVTPLTPRNDWSQASVSPTNDYTVDTYYLNLNIQKDTAAGKFSSYNGNIDTNINAHPYFVRVGFSRAASPPAAPGLIAPANNSTDVSLMPVMSWSANGLNYHLQISTNSGFSSILYEQNSLSFSQHQIPSGYLNSSGVYYWRVSSINEFGEGGFSSANSFTTTSQTIPSAPILISPINGVTNVPLKPQFDWNDVPGASSYRVLLSHSGVFPAPLLLDSAGFSSSLFNVPFNLFPLRKYFWKVCATNTAGTGAYSGVDSFIVEDLAPPTLISPADSTITTITVNLNWNTVQAADWYKYQVSEFEDFHTWIHNGTSVNPTVTIDNLPLHSKWYWRIRAGKEDGLGPYYYGPYSTIRSFTTAISPPTLVSPFNGQQGVLLNPTLTWNSVAGRTGYSFIISRSSNFIDTVYTNISDTTFFALPTNLLEINTLYYWKVRSRDSIGYGTYSSAWNFKSRLTGTLNSISEIIPTEYKLFSNYPNPFNPATKIKFDLPKSSLVRINIFDITGRMISEIVNQNLSAGSYETEFNGTNLSSGIYYYRIEAGEFVTTKKMILIK